MSFGKCTMDMSGSCMNHLRLSPIWRSYIELAIIQGSISSSSFLFQVDNYTKLNSSTFDFSFWVSVISTPEISSSHMCSLIFFHLLLTLIQLPQVNLLTDILYCTYKPQNSYVQVGKHKKSIQNTTKLRKRPALHFELFQAQWTIWCTTTDGDQIFTSASSLTVHWPLYSHQRSCGEQGLMQPWVGPSPSSSWQLCDFGQLLNPHPTFLICNVCAKSLQLCPTLCDPMDCGHQAPLSKEFSRQEYWNRLPFPSPGSVMWDHNKIYHLGLLWRRQWHPTPVLLPGKSYGQRSLVGCSPWGRWGSDTTEQLHFHVSLSCTGEVNGNPLQCSCLENPRDGGAWWAAVCGVA